MKSIEKLLIILALAIIISDAFAIPANPRPRMLTQPDGTKFSAVLKGDEHFHFAEDADGFSLIQDKNGWWTFAKQENGLLVNMDLKVGKSYCPYPRHLRPSAEAVAALPQNANKMINVSVETRHKWSTDMLYGVGQTKPGAKAVSGRQYMNVVLGDFSDSTFAWYAATEKAGNNPYTPFPYDHTAANNHSLTTAKWFNYLVYGDSISPYVPDSSMVGSMSTFYFDLTFRKCWWYGDVSDLVATGVTRAASVATGGAPSATYYNAALSGADATVEFDQDNNGLCDGLILIHPGPGQEESADINDIWSMSMVGSFGTYDGVSITKLIACPQNGQLGVFAHEMFHQIGGPDLYDYGYSGTPWGGWSLMDMGSYNGNLGGNKPAFPGGHLTYDVDGHIETGADGWMTDGAVGNCDSISSLYRGDGQYTIAPLDSAGEARRGNVTSGIRLWRIRNNAFLDSGQVFFVELRNRTPPYEDGLSESGLIITHIDSRMGGGARFNDGPPCTKYYYSWVEQPGFDPNLIYATGDSIFPREWLLSNAAYSANDINLGGYAENAIDSLTVPNCHTNRGTGTGPWIYDVSNEGPTMTFKVARTGLAAAAPLVGYQSSVVLDPVINFTANNNNGMLDPWETDTIKVILRNTGAAITAGARCSLYVVSGGLYVESIFGGTQAIGSGTMSANAEAQSGPFVVKISKYAPKFFDITFAVKIMSFAPAYSGVSYFTQRVSGLALIKTYDFQNIRVGGTTYNWRVMPSSVAVLADTVFISNANLDNAAFQTRVYVVKKNTDNNPLLPTDTIRSMNNRGTVHVTTKYAGGIDIDNSKNLWISLQDSVYSTNRSATVLSAFQAPNCSWAGTPMKRIRGIAFGPSVIDTVGPDPMPGDSLWVYWQNYDAYSESLLVISKPPSGTAVKHVGYSWDDPQAFLNTVNGKGEWWNGRALEYDGSSIWTSSVFMNYLIRRNPINGQLVDIMPGPSNYGSYGTYGMAIEATNSAGVPYAPVGAIPYAPGANGNRFYLYCAAMDEGKVYKLDVTTLVAATPPDSVKVIDTGPDNRIEWWKTDVDEQKVRQYNVYRQPPGTTWPPTASDLIATVKHVYGAGISNSYVDVGAGTKSKVVYLYSITASNYYSSGEWGGTGIATAYEEEISGPVNYELLQSYPNPAGQGAVKIKFTVKSPGRVSLVVYNVLGEKVKTLVNDTRKAGFYTVSWNGTNDKGRQVSNGIYFYQMTAGDYEAVKKMTILR